MSKSIQEQCDALAEKWYPLNDAGHLSDSAYYERAGGHDGFKVGFGAGYVEGTKARDVQWLEVVNELSGFKFKSIHFPTLTTNDEAADMANRIMNELFTKADQMLKEMGIESGR